MAKVVEGHDPKLIELYEVIGCHFVDVTFNHIFQAAMTLWRNNKCPSVTDAYTQSLTAYVVQNKKGEGDVYARTMHGLYEYVKMKLPTYSVTVYGSFIDRFSRTLIPDDVFESTRSEERDEITGTAICDLISNLCSFVTSAGVLTKVIDERQRSVETAQLLQDHAVQSLLSTRERLHNKFLGKVVQAKDVGSREQVTKLIRALKQLATEKASTDAELKACQEELASCQEELAAGAKLQKALRGKLQQTVNNYAQREHELVREVNGLRAALERYSRSLPAPPATSMPAPPPIPVTAPLTYGQPKLSGLAETATTTNNTASMVSDEGSLEEEDTLAFLTE